MKMILIALVVMLSTMPCCLICADGILWNVIGFGYAAVWLWIANSIMGAYEVDKDDTQAD